MDGYRDIIVILIAIGSLNNVSCSNPKETKMGGLHIPEKIIGGVIEIVQSHKNKPGSQQGGVAQGYPTQQYPPSQVYPSQQYPQYQQWNPPPNFSNAGYQPSYQGQFQHQGQYSNYVTQGASTYPQTAPNYPQPVGNYPVTTGSYPSAPVQGIYGGQSQSQGQYQVVPPNQQAGQFQGQLQQPGSQFQGQNQQSVATVLPPQTIQNQQIGQLQSQFQGQNQQTIVQQGQNQQVASQVSVQNPQTVQVQGVHGSGSIQTSGSQVSNGFLVSGGHQVSGNGQGPTCVCQAWTKPQSEAPKDNSLKDNTGRSPKIYKKNIKVNNA